MRSVRWSVVLFASYAVIGGVVTLIGWFAGLPRLTDWADSGISMYPNAACAAVFSGLALLLAGWSLRWPRRVSGLLGLVVAVLGSATLFEHFSGLDLGIDQLLITPAWGNKAAIALGRMGPPASSSYTLLGIALILLASGRASMRRIAPSFGIVVSAIAALSLMGYILGANPLFAVARYTGIAMQTALTILALGLGIVASAPECEPVRTLQQDSAAGLLVRRSLPFIVLLPIILGWILVRGQLAHFYDPAMGTSLLALITIAILCGLLWWWSRALGKYESALRQSRAAEATRRSELEREVTERKRAQDRIADQAKALGSAHARLHGIISSAMDAVITIDAQQRIVLFNPAAETMFGLSAGEAEGQDIQFLVPQRFRSSHGRFVAAFGSTRVSSRKMGALGAISGLRADGEEFPIEASISQTEIAGEKLFTVILRDITERQKAEERQGRLAAIVDNSEDAIVSKTLDGIVTSWNPGAEALFGYSAAEMNGRSIRQIIPAECAPEEDVILIRLRAGEALHRETVRITKNGRRVPVSITCSPVKNRDGTVIGGSKIARNITEQKEAEEKLRDAQRKLLLHAADLEATVAERTAQLQETVHELQSFSYSIAHDMRAPLRAMGTFAHLLMDEMPPGAPPETRSYCERIMIGAERLDHLINDALNYTKAALQEVALQPVDLSKLMRGLLDTYPNLHRDLADIQLEQTLPIVLGNESLLTQCFSNLLGNAVKFVAPGVRAIVRVWSETRDGVARISVEDNGIGIPPHAQPRLFAMFQKLDNQYEGTGMGLAIVRKVVERMSGTVGVESSPERGSRFWVELRVAPKKENP